MGDTPLTERPLAVLTRVSNGERLEIRKDATAGRNEGCEIPLTQTYASRNHAKIIFIQGSPWVEDMGSGNGTFVNEVQISARVQLKSGDRVRFYAEEFVVILPEPELDTSMTVVAPPPAQMTPPPPAPVVAPVVVPAIVPAIVRTPPQDDGAQKRPGAWAHTLGQPGAVGKSTKYIPATEIKQMMETVEVPAISPPDMDDPYLQVVAGQRASENLPLRAGAANATEWSIGSDPQRDVVLPDDGVSAFHARIRNEGKRWRVVDEMSANGTFVNGKRSSVSFLSSGDRMRFGPVVCVFQTAVSPATPPPEEVSQLPGRPSKARWHLWAIAAAGVVVLLFVAYQLTR